MLEASEWVKDKRGTGTDRKGTAVWQGGRTIQLQAPAVTVVPPI